MSLTHMLAGEFPPQIKQRGFDYFRGGAVEISYGDAREVDATVQGSRPYPVGLALDDDDRLTVFCGCPYFEGDSLCKHVWATLLAAEARGFLVHPAYEHPWIEREVGGAPAPVTWSQQLREIAASQKDSSVDRGRFLEREILYTFNVSQTRSTGHLAMEISHRDLKKDGTWGKIKPQAVSSQTLSELQDPADRQIFSMLLGSSEQWHPNYLSFRTPSGGGVFVPRLVVDLLVPMICQTGRGRMSGLESDGQEPVPLKWDEGPAWEFCLQATLDDAGRNHIFGGRLERGDERTPLEDAAMLSSGFVFGADGVVARLDDFGVFGWISLLRQQGPLEVPVEQSDEFLRELLGLKRLPRLDLPESLEYQEAQITPRPRLQIFPGERRGWAKNPQLQASLSFDYEGEVLKYGDGGRGIFRAGSRRFVLRDLQAEADAAETLRNFGFRLDPAGEFHLAPGRLPAAVRSLAESGWYVEAEGKVYRTAGEWHMQVRSGIDWFELQGNVEFGDTSASLPELLAAASRGENFIQLGDGTLGLLPEEWLERYGMLAGLGDVKGEGLRFQHTQVGLLDALLASQPEATFDEVFVQVRDRLRSFEGVRPAGEPARFAGKLRGYQRQGLGWLGFLREFGFGGCLADDMGLGKTVQVLALLESRRALRAARNQEAKPPPSLVVVPKSLVFNWRQEAQRFTPELRILDHTGPRLPPGEHFEKYDVILTTYGTLRRDAALLKDFRFDYCILDEAQAVKNAATVSAKAVRLIGADHRLALSGTPIENHLGELWSLFEFLNPGMLGSASAFRLGTNGNRNPDEATRALLSRALRPFILRRTKDQVAADLPAKTEQTLYCELRGAQRRRYHQLRDHYRQNLLKRVDREGIGRSKMFVLEALLRLRQAACHPGLIDRSKAPESSAKLDLLVPQLAEVAEEGHKALVFSQFTKLLAIVRDRLDREGVFYEYLDGRTRDRRSKVERFQNDPECQVFLISLKAGGLGLNLTAAEYVFLLDPWWNPAVEAQAIDRTHRIGQTRPVFAYRIIARDTVEEKVLQLQESKRALADVIITADNSLIRRIQREDLELLLS